jgi:hypothetical protein
MFLVKKCEGIDVGIDVGRQVSPFLVGSRVFVGMDDGDRVGADVVGCEVGVDVG